MLRILKCWRYPVKPAIQISQPFQGPGKDREGELEREVIIFSKPAIKNLKVWRVRSRKKFPWFSRHYSFFSLTMFIWQSRKIVMIITNTINIIPKTRYKISSSLYCISADLRFWVMTAKKKKSGNAFVCFLDYLRKWKTQPAFKCSKLTIETLKQSVKYV